MPKIPFTKPATTYQQQIDLLRARGLKIDPTNKIQHLLCKLGYYRMSGYWYPLLDEPKGDHLFKSGATFQTAFEIYRFDRDLRIFILKELEKLEVAVRAQMTYVLCHKKGVFWLSDPANFKDIGSHDYTFKKLYKDFQKSDEEFLKAFKDKYNDPLPPSWMSLEIASFGALSTIYSNLKHGKTKREIAEHFGLDDSTFTSWLHCFTYIRNVCAHHARLWNRGMSIKPQKPETPDKTWLKNETIKNNRTYYVMSMMLYLLQSVDNRHQFIFRLKLLFRKYPNIDPVAMGFPKDWEIEPLWRFNPTVKQRIRLTFAYALR